MIADHPECLQREPTRHSSPTQPLGPILELAMMACEILALGIDIGEVPSPGLPLRGKPGGLLDSPVQRIAVEQRQMSGSFEAYPVA